MKLGRETAEVILTSADIGSALQQIADHKISVDHIEYLDPLRLKFSVSGKELKRLYALAAGKGDTVELQRRGGIVSALHGLCRRPFIVLGMIGLIFLSCWLPTRVFFVRVEGNDRIPEKEIIQYAEKCGIFFGASRRQVRSEKVKNNLLSSIPQLQWAGINTYGCTAVITVRERNDLSEESPEPSISSIVALRDGVIREMTVLQGNPLCQVGQAVRAGQTLVSPYTDCGICIRATGAKGEIFGETQRQLSSIYPTEYSSRGSQLRIRKKYSIIIGKKRINLFKGSGISGGTCAKIYEEKYLTLPGGFDLPIGIAREVSAEYEVFSASSEKAQAILPEFAERYLQYTMQAGKILETTFVFSHGEEYSRMDGIFSCYEMIGILRPEESFKKYE